MGSLDATCGCAAGQTCLSGLLGSLLHGWDSPVLLYDVPTLGLFSKLNNIGLQGSASLCLHSQCFAVTSSPGLITLPSCLQTQGILQGGHLREAALAPWVCECSMSLDNGKLFCKVIVPICTLMRTLRANPLLPTIAKMYYCWVLSFLPIW